MLDLYTALLANLGLLAALFGLQVVARLLSHGPDYALSSLDADKTDTAFQGRISRTTRNQVEFLVLLTPLLFLASQQSDPIQNAETLAMTFLAVRALYVVIALAGIAYLRSVTWLVGFAALAYLAVQVA